MDFSVIVCTYNRSANLPRCVGHLLRQDGPSSPVWEILVVDNNSSDDTRKVVERLAQEATVPVRYVFEGEQGLNYARNRGVLESQGTYFAFIDDDIAVSPGWLTALYQCLSTNDADSAGGRIHLDPDVPLPNWIHAHPELKGFLGFQDYGDQPLRLDGVVKYPYGGNMAFHRRVVERIGLFNPKLGRKGSGRKRGELFKGAETDYCHRLAEAGGRFFYAPEAIVYHKVEPFQLKKSYFRTIHFNAGYQKALYDEGPHLRRFLGVPFFLWAQLGRGSLKYFLQLAALGPDSAFRQQMTVGYTLGMMQGYRRSTRPLA